MAKKKVKNLNVKSKKVKNIRSESEALITKFIVLLVVIIAILIGVYFLSKAIVSNRENNTTENLTEGKIDYNITNVGTILNRPYEEYYVIAYDSSDSEAIYYSALISKYQAKEGSIKLYFCDLGIGLNEKYKSENDDVNLKTESVSDLRFGKVSLLHIKNNKIINAYDSVEKIKTTLQ